MMIKKLIDFYCGGLVFVILLWTVYWRRMVNLMLMY